MWYLMSNVMPKLAIIWTPEVEQTNTVTKATVMILSFRTDMPGQTVRTQIRLLREEQSDL